jgi:hypothetical protein
MAEKAFYFDNFKTFAITIATTVDLNCPDRPFNSKVDCSPKGHKSRKEGNSKMKRYVIAVMISISIIFMLCLSCAVSSPFAAPALAQPGRCVAAVGRVQQAVTAEAHIYADARRTMCQYISLSPDMRQGKPEAINNSTQQKLATAKQTTAAAYEAARGCNTSTVKRPEVVESSVETVDAYTACLGPQPGIACSLLTGQQETACYEARAAKERKCAAVLQQLDCNSTRVVEDTPSQEEEPIVTVPGDLKPACRDAYLQFKAAEREYDRASKRAQAVAPGSGVAGPRGTAMYNAAREDMNRAAEKQQQAKLNLDTCTGGNVRNDPRPPASNPFNGSWVAQDNHTDSRDNGAGLKNVSITVTTDLSGVTQFDYAGYIFKGRLSGDTFTFDYYHDGGKYGSGSLQITGDQFSGKWQDIKGHTGTLSGRRQ